MIPAGDLELLRTFDSRGRITLTAYLSLDTPKRRQSAYDDFVQHMRARLDECGSDRECREAIQEDMEIVGLYLKGNGHRRARAVALFSCAAELFWRAYPLTVPVPTQVTVGTSFDLGPLVHAAIPVG